MEEVGRGMAGLPYCSKILVSALPHSTRQAQHSRKQRFLPMERNEAVDRGFGCAPPGNLAHSFQQVRVEKPLPQCS